MKFLRNALLVAVIAVLFSLSVIGPAWAGILFEENCRSVACVRSAAKACEALGGTATVSPGSGRSVDVTCSD